MTRVYLITDGDGNRTRFVRLDQPDPPMCDMGMEHGVIPAQYRAQDDPLDGPPDPQVSPWNLCAGCMGEVLQLQAQFADVTVHVE